MPVKFREVATPTTPTGTMTPDQAVVGPRIPPQQQLMLYSPGQWEDFVEEWAHFCLQSHYVEVARFTGAGDLGIDIAGFTNDKRLGLQSLQKQRLPSSVHRFQTATQLPTR